MFGAVLLGLIWGLSQDSLAQHCVEQLHRKESVAGKSITIPCSFSYPRTVIPDAVSFLVKAGYGNFCGRENEEIYDSLRNYTSAKYGGRLSVQLDLGSRTSSVTIKDLRMEDQLMYCCRFIILVSNKVIEKWQHPVGTFLMVEGEKAMILEEEFLLLALPGDTVTLIARFTIRNLTMTPRVTACGVFKGCGDELYPGNCTQRNNESIAFIKIHNADTSVNDIYCYSVNVSVGGTNYTRRTNNGSRILVLGQGDTTKDNQTTELEVMGSIMLNCTLSLHKIISAASIENTSVLWTQVYWMYGEPREHFIYHPNQDYIHPEYKGKTKLIGHSDLLLEDFPGPDNLTLYCRIAIRFCSGKKNEENPIKTILEEGPGILLRVLEKAEPTPEPHISGLQTIIIGSCVSSAFLLLLVLCIICWKRKKEMQSTKNRETIVESISASVYYNSAYENGEEIQKKATEPDEKLVYAAVKHSATIGAKKPQPSSEQQDDKVVYTAVKPSASTGAKKPQVSKESEIVYGNVKKH
ncbi:uncharacterized protein [Engystomops pustulosus]|uniref:uncharacterized protein isoform X2 n=1 Tax=Engystomops pustulosus TaxID=76066 RepID=UPI003AFB78B7